MQHKLHRDRAGGRFWGAGDPGSEGKVRLKDLLLRRRTIVDSPALEAFLDQQAAFMAQKGIYEYSRARSGLLSSKLFAEPSFVAAVETARWRGYPLCLQSAAVMSEHTLRPHAGDASHSLREGLIESVASVCRRYPPPPGLEPDFWTNAADRIARRVRQAGLAAPHAIKDIPLETAKEYFAGLPIHPDLRGFDFELVTNNLRVNLCRAYEDLIASADLPRLARSLIANAAATGQPPPR